MRPVGVEASQAGGPELEQELAGVDQADDFVDRELDGAVEGVELEALFLEGALQLVAGAKFDNVEDVAAERDRDRSRPTGDAPPERLADELRQAGAGRGLDRPLGDLGEEWGELDLLQRLPVAELAGRSRSI